MTERTPLPKDMIRSNPALCRAIISCRVGRDAMDGTLPPPQMATPTEYALYNLLHAIEDIATALAEMELRLDSIEKWIGSRTERMGAAEALQAANTEGDAE